MKLFVDNQVMRMLVYNPDEVVKHSIFSGGNVHISFDWPSLLEFLDLATLYAHLPPFDKSQPLFNACVTTLYANENEEVIYQLYDRLFVECLTQVKNLPHLNHVSLLQTIQEKQKKLSSSKTGSLISTSLIHAEEAFEKKGSHLMHDLILYLAWDRMCVYMARLFDYQSTDIKFMKNLYLIRGCLIESYQHITKHGRTSPSFYRLIEALFYYQMREENLYKHTDLEWALLNQSFQVFKSQDELADFLYIDHGVVPIEQITQDSEADCYLTLEPIDKVNTRLVLARNMINQLKSENPDWDFVFRPGKVVCFP